MEQQEGAEDLVRALRQELHNLRQDTNSVAANARQTVSEKEALQVNSPGAFHVVCLGSRDAPGQPGPNMISSIPQHYQSNILQLQQ